MNNYIISKLHLQVQLIMIPLIDCSSVNSAKQYSLRVAFGLYILKI